MFLEYLTKITFHRKMTQLVCSPWFKDFWRIFRGGGGIKNLGKLEILDLGVVEDV